ncbi:MAG TPA: PucR family transcriptional regulator ligand-binding domain-containing protein [Thermoleophilia bacterium]
MAERSPSEALTLRELVAAGGLGVELVAGQAGIDRAVEAVYIGDLEDPTPWMVEGSLLLTTGPRFEEDPGSAARLVELLKQSGMVGVGVGIMPYLREIPAEMVAAADREGLPLLRVPEGTPFREITSYVFHALSSRDMHRLRRSVALQKQLLEVLLAEPDPSGLVRRVGELLGASMLLFSASGRLAGSFMTANERGVEAFTREVWSAYKAVAVTGTPRSVLDVEGRHVAFREARADGAVEQVLMAAYPEGSLISEFADEALTFAQRLLEVEATTGRNVSMLRRRTRSGLLDMLIHRRGSASELSERLNYHGIEPTELWRMLAFSVGAPGGSRRDHPSVADAMADALLGTIDRLLEEGGVPFLSRQSRGQVLVLAPLADCADPAAVLRFVTDVAENAGTRLRTQRIDVGVSSALSGLDLVPRAAGQARLALRHADLAGGGTAQVVAFDDLGRRYKVLDSLSDAQLQELADAVVGRLIDADRHGHSDLLRTLEVYLACGGSAADAAAELYVHRNTLRKRVARIEEILGVDLGTVGGLVEAYLAVRAQDVLATRKG